jgi:hypothetical protein
MYIAGRALVPQSNFVFMVRRAWVLVLVNFLTIAVAQERATNDDQEATLHGGRVKRRIDNAVDDDAKKAQAFALWEGMVSEASAASSLSDRPPHPFQVEKFTIETAQEDTTQNSPPLDPDKALRDLKADLTRHFKSPELTAMMNPQLSGVLLDAPAVISTHAEDHFRLPQHSEVDTDGLFRRRDGAPPPLTTSALGGFSDLGAAAWMMLPSAADDRATAPKPWGPQDVRRALEDAHSAGAAIKARAEQRADRESRCASTRLPLPPDLIQPPLPSNLRPAPA